MLNHSRTTRWSVFALLFVIVAVGGVFICGYAFERYSEFRDGQRFPPPGRLVDVGNRHLHLDCSGQGSPTIVIETGAGAPSFAWRGVQSDLSKTNRTCTYDRAGLGWSDPGPRGRSVEDRANDLADVLARGEVAGPFVIVAHSYGALIAQRFIESHLENVVGVVFVDAFDRDFVSNPQYLAITAAEVMTYKAKARRARFGIQRISLLRGTKEQQARDFPVDVPFLEKIGLTAAGLTPKVYEEYADELSSFPRTPQAQRSSAPPGAFKNLPLVVIGHGRPFTGALMSFEREWNTVQERISKLSSRGEFIIADSGHEIHRDAPDMIVSAVRKIIASAMTAKASGE